MKGRILILAPDLSGNSTLTAWEIRGALEAAGYEPVLAGALSGALWAPLGTELAEAVTLGPPSVFGAPASADRLAARADLIYAFKALPSSLGMGMRLAHRHRIPLALHLDDWDAGFLRGGRRLRRLWWSLAGLRHPESELWLALCEQLVPWVDALTVSTYALRRRFGGTVVRQGVDTNRFSPGAYPRVEARRRLGVGPSEPMVLFLGTPRLHKGIGALLSLDGLAGALWIVGMHPGAAAELGLDEAGLARVRVRPPLPFSEAAWYLAACDVFVVPQEPTLFAEHQLPAKILAAMALGTPVVTTDVGDADSILGGNPAAGVVVAAGDPEAFGRAVEGLLADPVRRGALGREARARAEAQYGWGPMARTLEGVLGPLLA